MLFCSHAAAVFIHAVKLGTLLQIQGRGGARGVSTGPVLTTVGCVVFKDRDCEPSVHFSKEGRELVVSVGVCALCPVEPNVYLYCVVLCAE